MLFFLFVLFCGIVFVCDIRKRIIPNVILVCFLILKAISLALNFDIINIIDSFVGLTIACIVFIIPKIFRLHLGWGDVKYSAVLGFCLGFANYIYAMLVAVLFVFIYYSVRRFLMKKDIKDFPLPLGSFMSVGAIVISFFEFIL